MQIRWCDTMLRHVQAGIRRIFRHRKHIVCASNGDGYLQRTTAKPPQRVQDLQNGHRHLLNCLCIMMCGMCLLYGCSTGGNEAPKPMTNDEVLARGQAQLESVTTFPQMDPATARLTLARAMRDYVDVLAKDRTNLQAKAGYAFAATYLGMYDLLLVAPDGLDTALLDLATQNQARSMALDRSALSGPLGMLGAVSQSRGTSPTAVQDVQLRIVSSTIPAMRSAIPLFSDVESATVSGTMKYQLRMYKGGQIQTVIFDVADIQLSCAFSNFVASMLYLSVSYNLGMPQGSTVLALPVDGNANDMFDAEEYLTAKPFLDTLYSQGLPYCLSYLRDAALKAQQGAAHSGHTMGPNALVNLDDPATLDALSTINTLGAFFSTACISTVANNQFFGDNTMRTYNLNKMTSITSLRRLLPSFQEDDVTANGIWPDPTFQGMVTPGIPPGWGNLQYDDIKGAY